MNQNLVPLEGALSQFKITFSAKHNQQRQHRHFVAGRLRRRCFGRYGGNKVKVIFVVFFAIVLSSCTHIGNKYLHDYDSVDKDKFELDLNLCEVQIEGKVPKKPIKESVGEHIASNIPTEIDSAALQIGVGASRGFLDSYVEKHQAMRRCLKDKGYSVKWLKP